MSQRNSLLESHAGAGSSSISSSSGSSNGGGVDPLASPEAPAPSVASFSGGSATGGTTAMEYLEKSLQREGSSNLSQAKAPLLSDADETESSYRPKSTSRLGNSCKFVVVGLFFLITSLVTLIANENRVILTLRFYRHLQETVHSISEANTAAAYGLVHITGQATSPSSSTVQDDLFGFKPTSVQPLRLSRFVQMYQWVESDDIGSNGDYTYEKEWDAKINDSDGFIEEHHPVNPTSMPFSSQVFSADTITVGSFPLSHEAIEKMRFYQSLPDEIKPENIPNADTQDRATVSQTPNGPVLYIRGDENDGQHDMAVDPQIGDSRISYSVVVPQKVSVVALLQDSTLLPYEAAWKHMKRKILLVEQGSHSAHDMLNRAAAREKRGSHATRWIALAFVYFGLLILAKPASVLEDALPWMRDMVGPDFRPKIAATRLLPVAVVVTTTAVALCWAFVHPLRSLIWLGVECVCIYYWGQQFEWWGVTATSASPSYQTLDDLTFMELGEV